MPNLQAKNSVAWPSDAATRSALRLALGFAAAKLLLQFALTLYTTHLGYSYFRDEFYYIACGRHLAWGYVDHGPVVAVQARLGEFLFGDSVFGIRVLSAFAGASTVFLGGIVAWALGGGRPAQALAMLGLLLCPQYLAIDGFLSMNSFEAVFWSLCLLAVIRIVRGSTPALWWTVFGLSAGIGLLNKPSMAFLLAALVGGLLLVPERRILLSRWTGFAVLLVCVLLAPYVHWQMTHHWATLEFLHNGRVGGKATALSPLQFCLAQLSIMGPLNVLLWVPGVLLLLRGRPVPGMRWLGLTFLLFFALMAALHAKDYYLEGIYPAFFAAGGVTWENAFASSPRVQAGQIFAFPLYEVALLIFSIAILPMSSPVLQPAAWVRYTAALHLAHKESETLKTGPLPQFFADRIGWGHEVDVVSEAFHALPAGDRRRVCLFGKNYGEAGAIDFLSRLHGEPLPPAISGQNNYWLWGMHGCDPNLVIAIIPDKPDQVARKYRSITVVGTRQSIYAMPFENGNIYLLRDRLDTTPFRWEDERFFY